jgi:hypothetical protein
MARPAVLGCIWACGVKRRARAHVASDATHQISVNSQFDPEPRDLDETAIATLIHQRRLTPSCGGRVPTAERTVGLAGMIAESLTLKPGIREHSGVERTLRMSNLSPKAVLKRKWEELARKVKFLRQSASLFNAKGIAAIRLQVKTADVQQVRPISGPVICAPPPETPLIYRDIFCYALVLTPSHRTASSQY